MAWRVCYQWGLPYLVFETLPNIDDHFTNQLRGMEIYQVLQNRCVRLVYVRDKSLILMIMVLIQTIEGMKTEEY